MEGLSKDLKQLDKNDHSLQDRYDDHLDRWRKLNNGMDSIHLQLKQLPERWKEYNQK
jgi:nesprin-1